MTDDRSGERTFQHRAPFTYAKNGKRSEDWIFINVKAWKAVAALFVAAAGIVATIHAVMVYVYEPRLRQTIQQEVKPLALEITVERTVMQQHLLEEAKAQGESVRRAELDERLARIEAKVDAVYRVSR